MLWSGLAVRKPETAWLSREGCPLLSGVQLVTEGARVKQVGEELSQTSGRMGSDDLADGARPSPRLCKLGLYHLVPGDTAWQSTP